MKTRKSYICRERTCGKEVLTKKGFREHTRVHSNELPYVCDTCERRFKWRSSLCSHRKVHRTAEDATEGGRSTTSMYSASIEDDIRAHLPDESILDGGYMSEDDDRERSLSPVPEQYPSSLDIDLSSFESLVSSKSQTRESTESRMWEYHLPDHIIHNFANGQFCPEMIFTRPCMDDNSLAESASHKLCQHASRSETEGLSLDHQPTNSAYQNGRYDTREDASDDQRACA